MHVSMCLFDNNKYDNKYARIYVFDNKYARIYVFDNKYARI